MDRLAPCLFAFFRCVWRKWCTRSSLLLTSLCTQRRSDWRANRQQERKRGLVIAERQEKEMQRVVENEQRMAELHKKILRVEEVRIMVGWAPRCVDNATWRGRWKMKKTNERLRWTLTVECLDSSDAAHQRFPQFVFCTSDPNQ